MSGPKIVDNQGLIVVDNMLSAWGSIPYAELSVLLVHLRFVALVHQTHHWTAKGDSFYGDHKLFEELYSATQTHIDKIAERAIGLGGEANVNMMLQVRQLDAMVQNYGTTSTVPREDDLARRSLLAERCFLRCAAHLVPALKSRNLLTRGSDNMLQGVEDEHERHVYLLKQRCG